MEGNVALRTGKSTIFATVLLLIQTALLIGLNWTTSLNRTEVGHLGAAVYFWKTGRFDVFHVNPPLSRVVCGLPVMIASPEYDWKSYSPRPQDRSEWSLGSSFIYANMPEKVRQCVFLARCSLIPLILLGSWFGYRFASELYGHEAGIVFLVLWTFSPLVLGWGATICPDVVAASLGIVAAYAFWRWLKSPTWGKATLAGLTLGLLPLSKMTWVIAFPLWIFIWPLWTIPKPSGESAVKPGWKQILLIMFIAVYTINMGYGFDGSFRQLKDYSFTSQSLTGLEPVENSYTIKPGNRFEKSFIGNIPVPLPAEFVQGIDTQRRDFERGIESYFRGATSEHGWWYYYAYLLAIREPLGIIVMALIAVCVSFFRKDYDSGWRDEIVLVLPFLSIFVLVSSQTGFSIHPRYIIPALPFAYIWISKLGRSFLLKQKLVSVTTACCLIWLIAGSIWYYPHSMSCFNETIGGAKNAPKHLLGSNIDWGQNLYFLKNWYEKHPDARPLFVSYSGAESLERLGMDETGTIPAEIKPGWYAIDVNELYGTKLFEPFKKLQPSDYIGYSIYIYHITENDSSLNRTTTHE